MLYAQALNETLSDQRVLGPSPAPGSGRRSGPGPGPGQLQRPKQDVVTPRMWNRTFPGEKWKLPWEHWAQPIGALSSMRKVVKKIV